MPDEVRSGEETPLPEASATPIQSRFLFVDVAARRAIQLKRGARVRIPHGEHDRVPHKLERIAMEEVKQGYIHYQVPDASVS
jgi:DNA-directed RNA polymerase omega subunit